jgi:hypothetical protein
MEQSELRDAKGRFLGGHAGPGRPKGARNKLAGQFFDDLMARGVTGKVTLIDAKTGKGRTVIDTENASKLRTCEPSKGRSHLVKWQPFPLGETEPS